MMFYPMSLKPKKTVNNLKFSSRISSPVGRFSRGQVGRWGSKAVNHSGIQFPICSVWSVMLLRLMMLVQLLLILVPPLTLWKSELGLFLNCWENLVSTNINLELCQDIRARRGLVQHKQTINSVCARMHACANNKHVLISFTVWVSVTVPFL